MPAGRPPMPFDALYMGDFNFDPADDEYEALVGPDDQSYGRVSYGDLLVDGWTAAGHPAGEGVTYPPNETYPNIETGWRLDYCFLTPLLARQLRAAWIDDDANGSDHQPMWLELDWP